MDISDVTTTDLEDDIIGPFIIEHYRDQVTKTMKIEQYLRILSIYVNSMYQDFENFLRTQIDLVQDDFELVLEEYNSKFITYEKEPGINTFKYLSEALFNILQPEYEVFNNSIDIELDDITMKNKLVVRPGIIAIRFDENSFLVLFWASTKKGIINTILNTLVEKLQT